MTHRIDRHDFAVLNELIEILVSGRDKALDTAGLRPGGKGSDYIICLNAFLNDELPAHRHDKLLNRADRFRGDHMMFVIDSCKLFQCVQKKCGRCTEQI